MLSAGLLALAGSTLLNVKASGVNDYFEPVEGLDFVSTGAPKGIAVFDYDNDGFLDILALSMDSQGFDESHSDGLLRNDGNGGFIDVTAESGVARPTDDKGSSGVITADFNNDGWTDVFVTGMGYIHWPAPATGCIMMENLGVDESTGEHLGFTQYPFTGDLECSASGTFAITSADYNGDGLLDIYVGYYGPFATANVAFDAQLFVNHGDFEFTNELDHGADFPFGCAAESMDLDNDGDMDIVALPCNRVGPDGAIRDPIYMFRNSLAQTGVMHFSDDTVAFGLGHIRAYFMGITIGDVDSDGDLDMFFGNIGDAPPPIISPHTIILNNGDGTYTEVNEQTGFAFPDGRLSHMGNIWGTEFLDVDNDGRLDLMASGTMSLLSTVVMMVNMGAIDLINPGFLLMNREPTAASSAGAHEVGFELELIEMGITQSTSGMTVGDMNNDGFTEALIAADLVSEGQLELSCQPGLASCEAFPDGVHPLIGVDLHADGRPQMYWNKADSGNNWVQLRLVGTTTNKGGVGAEVTVIDTSDRAQAQVVAAGSSCGSTRSPILTYGLGQADGLLSVKVAWPATFQDPAGPRWEEGGNRHQEIMAGEREQPLMRRYVEEFKVAGIKQLHVLVQGEGVRLGGKRGGGMAMVTPHRGNIRHGTSGTHS